MSQASVIAYLALILVAPAAIVAFATLTPPRAALVLIVGGLMFLPSSIAFDPPAVPPLDKFSIPALCMLIAVFATSGRRVWAARPRFFLMLLMVVAIVGVLSTNATNHDPLRYGPTKIQGLTSSDAVSDVVSLVLNGLTPFFIGATLFRTAEDAKDLLRAFALGALIYLPFILVELRMSPQWHAWVYGYSPSSFAQTVRESGYRPMVFMNHGLTLAMFVATAMMGSWALVRVRAPLFGFAMKPFAWVVTVLLVLVNSLGALIYGVLVAPAIRYLRPKTQLTIACCLALVVVAYPGLRSAGYFPAMEMVELAASYSDERAESLAYRFGNEDRLLEKALERPLFGWGGWGRSRVFNEWGTDISVTDGLWVIILGSMGQVGFLSRFGLMLVPIFLARKRIGQLDAESQTLLGAVGMISVVHAVDLIPNAGCGNFFMFLPGALAGLAAGMSKRGATGIDPVLLRLALARLRAVLGVSQSRRRTVPPRSVTT